MSRPDSFNEEAKASNKDRVSLPKIRLQPARLVTSSAARKAEAEESRSGQSMPQSQDEALIPRGALRGLRPNTMTHSEEPRAQARQGVPTFATLSTREQAEERWSELESWLHDAWDHVANVLTPARKALRIRMPHWRAVVRPKLVGAAALCAVAVFLWNTPSVSDPVGSAVQPYLDEVKARAAFHIEDDFSNGVGEWWDRGLVLSQPGQVRVAGLALHTGTMDLASYRLDFDAKIESHSVGWLVRAADRDTYYAFQLRQGRKGAYQLLRHAVVNGKPDETQKAEVNVPEGLVQDDFNRVSVRLRDNQIVTLINGRGVDFWSDSRLPKGGVGFWVDKGDSGVIRRVTVSGNEDFWGLTLYAAMETGRSVKNFLIALADDPSTVGAQLRKGVSEISVKDFVR